MVFLKKKPVIYAPLPSLATILQPLSATVGEGSGDAPIDPATEPPIPADSEDDNEQLEMLRSVFRGEFEGAHGNVGPGKGKKAGTRLLHFHEPNGVAGPSGTSGYDSSQFTGYDGLRGPVKGPEESGSLDNEGTLAALVAKGAVSADDAGNGVVDSTVGQAPAETAQPAPVHWRIWDRDCYYIPETGEVFTDYESFLNRVMFYQQPLYSCETTSKNNQTYYKANESEIREAKNLHTRFPRQLKFPVLSAVQFQLEGKMDKLVDAVFDRFQARFYIGERVFAEYDGERYLAKIVDITPPASNASVAPHVYASDLNMDDEELVRLDNAMEYSYTVRLIEEGSEPDLPKEYAGEKEQVGDGYRLQISPDKISRLHFSKMMLKRFLRDCVFRDAAVYSPWMLKPAVAERYGLPVEMPDEVRDRINLYREQKMDQRKREREERMGITHGGSEPEVVDEDKPKGKKAKHAKEEPVEEEELPKLKKPVLKYPIDDLLIKFNPDFDGAQHQRLKVRPALERSLPFGDHFEKFLMSWSFLNVMGKPLGLSPFTLDDYEQALYHNDPYTSPTPLLVEIHATLINALIADLASGAEPVKPISHTGMTDDLHDDGDYWEGFKGATTDTLRPVVDPLGKSWFMKYLSPRDGRKGWESALVGCLWDRATLDILPNYLDNILHLTFEKKPPPTRPTWATGPPLPNAMNGLIISKPEKRYASLHHLHKLEIVAFLTELAAQTAKIRDFMEEETAALTESRKEQVEVKREWKRIHAEVLGLEPKEEVVNGEGTDIDAPASERHGSVDPSVNGHTNGNKSATDRDELESSLALDDGDDLSEIDMDEAEGPTVTAASRRRAMKERAAERDAEEAMRVARVAEDKARKSETKHASMEKKRLQDEYKLLTSKLRLIDYDLRAHMFALRSSPLGQDRFGNKVWWFDGYGSSPLVNEKGQTVVGTGKIFIQGGDDQELELMRLAVEHPSAEEKQGLEGIHRPSASEVAERRKEEEGERVGGGEWASIETVDQLHEFMKWLNPRGNRDSALLKRLNTWLPEIEASIRKRRMVAGLDDAPEGEEPIKKHRPVRKVVVAGGMDRDRDDDGAGHLAYKNRRAKEK